MSGRLGRVVASGLAVAIGAAVPAWAGGVTERVSVSTGGGQANDGSFDPALSADGRFVAFYSRASNLVPGDTNGFDDVFVRDRRQGRTERVSVGPGGVQGDADSYGLPAISADGRFVAFVSGATNLVPGDTNGFVQVFVRDRQTGTTQRVSVGPRGAKGDADSFDPAISAGGRFVAFTSWASNLVPGDTNDTTDVFVRDRQTGTTRRVSVGPRGVQGDAGSYGPALSADGRFVAFQSSATNLVPGDTNGAGDVFVRDRRTRRTERVSVSTGGVQSDRSSGSAAISADGRFVAFYSAATNLVPGDTNGAGDVFVRDRRTGRTERASVSTGGVQGDREGSDSPAISADGRFVAFVSWASNLVPVDTLVGDVFVRDRRAGTTRRVSVGPGGVQGNGTSYFPALSADGRFVAFPSIASNLVPGDTNDVFDVFVRRRW